VTRDTQLYIVSVCCGDCVAGYDALVAAHHCFSDRCRRCTQTRRVRVRTIGERSIVMSVSVCVSVSLYVRDHIFGTTRPIFTIFARVTYGRGSVLLWRRSDTLCTSGFVDDVIFARKPRLLDVAAQLKRSAHATLGLAINCAQ